jgi:hypothetical protein
MPHMTELGLAVLTLDRDAVASRLDRNERLGATDESIISAYWGTCLQIVPLATLSSMCRLLVERGHPLLGELSAYCQA